MVDYYQIRLRIPAHLENQVKSAAASKGVSVNTWLVQAMESALGDYGASSGSKTVPIEVPAVPLDVALDLGRQLQRFDLAISQLEVLRKQQGDYDLTLGELRADLSSKSAETDRQVREMIAILEKTIEGQASQGEQRIVEIEQKLAVIINSFGEASKHPWWKFWKH